MSKKIIAVLGATGAQGGGLVRAILNDPSGGFAARAITRDPNSDKARELEAKLRGLGKTYGDKRRTRIVERREAQAIKEKDLAPVDPVTVILSANGWVRAAKGHDVDARALDYKTGDKFLQAARGKSNQIAVFLDTTGRSYVLPAHKLPSARGHGEPLASSLNPPPGATWAAGTYTVAASFNFSRIGPRQTAESAAPAMNAHCCSFGVAPSR